MPQAPKLSFGKLEDDSHATVVRALPDWKVSPEIHVLESIRKYLFSILANLIKVGFVERRKFEGEYTGQGRQFIKYEYRATEAGMAWADAYVASLYKS
jgi:hypothetical protein